MFYTLGDYRDIVVRGGHKDGSGKEIVVHTSDDKDAMQKIQEKIDTILKQSGDTPAHKPSDEQRKTLWDRIAEHVWNGMICALTHKTETPGHVDEDVKGQLFENGKNTLKSNYQYTSVTIGASGTEAKTNPPKTPSPSGEKTTLVDFISRPPYFRYLEEWGQNFCKERKKRLEKIKGECKVGENGYGRLGGTENPKCSCYGEHCEDNLNKPYDTLPSLECPGCGRECRKYRKWINTKKTEFDKQKSAYEQQQKKCKEESDKAESDNEFYTRLKTYKEAKDFLQNLAPCKNNDSKLDEIKFDDEGKTFGHETYCKPCSQFNVNCKVTGNCDNNKGENCNGTTDISPNDIGNGGNSAEDLVMLVSDNSATGFEVNGLKDCEDAGIFKGIRKEEWKCRNVCGYNVCKPKNSEGKKVSGERNGENQIILITAFVKHWVENFLEDYNNVKHKISHCIKNDDGSKCIKVCDNKCKCVEKWIKLKRDEWKTIKDRFNDQYKNKDSVDYPVKTILEELIPQIGAAKDKDKVIKLSKFEDSKGCCVSPNSEKSKDENAIDCMINRLQDKIDKCKEKHPQPSAENQAQP
ncbi:hypothetical protein PFFCH_05303, partial [Plasmodium falciparum FCH/4]